MPPLGPVARKDAEAEKFPQRKFSLPQNRVIRPSANPERIEAKYGASGKRRKHALEHDGCEKQKPVRTECSKQSRTGAEECLEASALPGCQDRETHDETIILSLNQA